MTFRTLVIFVALAGFSPAHAASATLRFGQIPSTARAVSSLYLYVAEKQGFFARENVTVEVVQIPGGTGNMVAALDRGEVDVTQTATPYLIQAALNGSPAVAIAGTTANPIYSLIAKPEIAKFADLMGKLIGLSLPVDTISMSMRKLLARSKGSTRPTTASRSWSVRRCVLHA
jgi:ABC-type nitrate/sulfonate/bicarbonate transport system substrate-binding protein